MKKIVMEIARTSKNFDEFCDRIYALDACIIISDLDLNIVEYYGDNNRWYSYDVSKYSKNWD